MKVSKNNVVALSYQLEVEGQIVDKASAEAPLEYIHGTHMLLPRFEEEVEGKEPGESVEFTLSAAEGYGEYKEELVISLPLAAFPEDAELRAQLLQIGQMLPLMSQDGQYVQGVITEILEDYVKVNLNHPMAGKTLHFTVTVVSVREATEKELLEGLHGEYLPQEGGCGGNCGGCHGGCHSEDSEDGCCGGGHGEGCHCGEGEGCCGGHGESCCHND